jgi:hypothetical protein
MYSKYSKKIEDVVVGDKVYIYSLGFDTFIGEVVDITLDTIVVKDTLYETIDTINKTTSISEEDSCARFEFFSV